MKYLFCPNFLRITIGKKNFIKQIHKIEALLNMKLEMFEESRYIQIHQTLTVPIRSYHKPITSHAIKISYFI